MVYTVTPALNFRFQSCLVLKTVPLVRMHKCADHLLDDVESTTTELELIPFTKLLLTLHTRLLLQSFEVVLHGKRVFIYLTQHVYNICTQHVVSHLSLCLGYSINGDLKAGVGMCVDSRHVFVRGPGSTKLHINT